MLATHPQPGEPRAYAALTRHADPILREIGAQLRDGRVRPHEILTSPAYRSDLRGVLARLRHATGMPEATGT